MLQSLIDSFFGCSHRRTTFPITRRGMKPGTANQTYVACLDCGKELSYSWQEMRMGQVTQAGPPQPAGATREPQPSFR